MSSAEKVAGDSKEVQQAADIVQADSDMSDPGDAPAPSTAPATDGSGQQTTVPEPAITTPFVTAAAANSQPEGAGAPSAPGNTSHGGWNVQGGRLSSQAAARDGDATCIFLEEAGEAASVGHDIVKWAETQKGKRVCIAAFTLPETGRRIKHRRITAPTKEEEEEEEAMMLCAACRIIPDRRILAEQHELSRCPFPTPKGDISGCVICNDLTHFYDECPVRKTYPDHARQGKDYHYCVVNRGGLPPVRSREVNWPAMMAASEHTRSLPKGYPATRAMCVEMLRANPPFQFGRQTGGRRLLDDPKTRTIADVRRHVLELQETEVFLTKAEYNDRKAAKEAEEAKSEQDEVVRDLMDAIVEGQGHPKADKTTILPHHPKKD